MIVIGLCGGSGSGKSKVSQLFNEKGYAIADTDMICHELFSSSAECISQLVSEFGEGILDEKGAICRKKLSAIVFGDREKLGVLNSISHYHILNDVRKIISDAQEKGIKGVLVDAPVLFESGFNEECDVVVAVLADVDIRIKRILERDSISEERARARIANQLSDEYLISRADYVIKNNGDLLALENEFCKVNCKIEERFFN